MKDERGENKSRFFGNESFLCNMKKVEGGFVQGPFNPLKPW